MIALEDKNESLILGLNYETREQTTFDGFKWVSHNAKIGDCSYMCKSYIELKERIANHKFPDNVKLNKAMDQFYNRG